MGKTTCAAAAAVVAAARGRRVLLVSTDPAHSLGDALDVRLAAAPRPIAVSGGRLEAVELDADRALARWIAARRQGLRTIAARGTYLDDEDLDRLLRLSLPGVDELVGLVELRRLARARPYDDVVVDTAPTGHTLRLLAMPETLCRLAEVLDQMQAKHRYLVESLGAGYRSDATDTLIEELDGEGRALMALLRDADRAAFSWIVLPEILSLEEAKHGIEALEKAGIHVGEIIANRVSPPPRADCAFCRARLGAERRVLRSIRRAFAGRRLRCLPARAREPRGVGDLRAVGRRLTASGQGEHRLRAPAPRATPTRAPRAPREAGGWLEAIAPASLRLLLFGGKGGTGKTTCAATVALAVAARDPGRRVLLLSTDPAHSLGDVLDLPLGDDEAPVTARGVALGARELDAQREFERRRARYRTAVDELFDGLRGSSRFDAAFDRALVHRFIDLAPPGLDELFGMLAVVDALFHRRPPYDLVVVDTAPTGHALRLLEMPKAALEWTHALLQLLLKYRALTGLGHLAEDLVALARDLRALQALLGDPRRTRFVPVMRAAELVQRETLRLLRALARLGIAAPTAILNAAVPTACCGSTRASALEGRTLRAMRGNPRRAPRVESVVQAPATAPPPRGIDPLLSWGRTWQRRA